MKNEKSKFNFGEIIRVMGKVLYWLIFTALVIIAGTIVFSNLAIPGNYKILSVQSGSMEPNIKLGSVVVIKPEASYKKGDVITFADPQNPKVTVTHRIFEVNEGTPISYITKGDANKTPDSEERPAGSVLGRVLFTIPFAGYPISYAKTRDGLLILVIIPATIIIYSEIISIKNEAVKLLAERKKRKLTLAEKAELEVGKEEIKVERWYQKLFKKNAK